jgi:hypothetical protein
MLSIYDLKELAVTDTPLLLFNCVLQNGQAEYWSTHQLNYAGNTYAPRVMTHNLLEVQTSSEQGVDVIPRVSLSMANADSYFSELERAVGWKGATLTVTFLFYNLLENAANLRQRRLVSRNRQSAGPKHGISFSALGHQFHEYAESAAASGAYPAAVSLALSYQYSTARGGGQRGQ